jgi:serine/threonine-protein kinase RsbW
MKQLNSRIVIKSHISQFYKLEQFVDNISDNYNIIHSFFSNITAVLIELVENAIVHGNKNEKEKDIIIEFEKYEQYIIFSISDQGNGFNYEIEMEKVIQIDEKMGTGLFLAKILSDNIEFENNGSTVRVMFDLSSANEQLNQVRWKVMSDVQVEQKKSHHEL